MSDTVNIVIAPNEDGFGTSAWVVMLAKELSRQPNVRTVKVVVATDRRKIFHSDKYQDTPNIRLIRLPGQTNKIEIPKLLGAVDIHATVEKCILTYAQSRAEYARALIDERIIDDADLIIDFGVPQLMRAAYGRKTVTVFDHSWSMSLERIVSSDNTLDSDSLSLRASLDDIRNDEALTQQVILFQEPICPLDYHGYWRRLLGQVPEVIPGVLGGPLRTLAYVQDSTYETTRSGLMESKGERYSLAKTYAKQILGIDNEEPVLFISGGGTAVWDEVLSNLLDDYEAKAPNYNIVIFNPNEANKRGVSLKPETIVLNGISLMIQRAKWDQCNKITFIETLEHETHHVLFAAFDLVLTRAGGGTVNNAIAFRVPLILVEEPGMWQVEQIRHSCMRMGLAEGVSLENFVQNSRQCVEDPHGELKDLKLHKAEMQKIPNHGEFWLSERLHTFVL
jgi:hypothetical protein